MRDAINCPHGRRDTAPALFAARKKGKKVPFDFVLDELADLGPWTRPMFGSTAVYVEEKIVFILRDRNDQDTGVWIATTRENHASLRRVLPNMRSITVFGVGETAWQVLPADPTTSRRACSGRARSFWPTIRGSGRCRSQGTGSAAGHGDDGGGSRRGARPLA